MYDYRDKPIPCAAPNQYRVVGVDTFDGTDWVAGDFGTAVEAVTYADKKGGEMLKMRVYDDQGKHIHDAGTF